MSACAQYVRRLNADHFGDDGVHAAFASQRQCAVLQNFVLATLKYIQIHVRTRTVQMKSFVTVLCARVMHAKCMYMYVHVYVTKRKS